MSKQEMSIAVGGVEVHLNKKKIKHVHLSVHPPQGRVRASVPKHLSDESIRLAIVSKLSWIKKQQKKFQDQPRQSKRCYVSGECHYFLGQAYRLELIEYHGKAKVELLKSGKIKLWVRANASIESKEKVVNAWYRNELKQRIPLLLNTWQPIIGKEVHDWGIKRMKTKWGSCNIEQKRIWLNLELAKKPPACLEYVLIHELVHLHERYHNARFKALVAQYCPNWKSHRNELNAHPLAHELWES